MQLLDDIRLGLRSLRRRRVFTLIALLTLAVAVGANTAVFSIVHSLLLRDLPFPEAERLVTVRLEVPPEEGRPGRVQLLEEEQVRTLRRASTSLAEVAAYGRKEMTLTGERTPEVVAGIEATPNLFHVLGIQQTRGLGFATPGTAGDAARDLVVTRALAQRWMGADAEAGGTVRVDQEPRPVTSIMPPGFYFPTPDVEAWIPLPPSRGGDGETESRYLEVVARLAEGATVAQAQQEVGDILRRLARQAGAGGADGASLPEARVVPLRDALVGDVRPALGVVGLAAALILLLACVNLANLLIARNAERRRDLAIRTALGGSRRGVVRQLVVESLVLGVLGGALGVLLAMALHRALPRFLPAEMLRLGEPELGLAALGFALAVSGLAGFFAGVFPALRGTRMDLSGLLVGGWSTPSAGVSGRGWVVLFEMALAAILLVGGLLLVGSFDRLTGVAAGYETEVLTGTLQLDPARYGAPERFVRLLDGLLGRIEAHPGVEAVSTVSVPPSPATMTKVGTDIEGLPTVRRLAIPQLTTSGLPDAMGLELVRGRWIDPLDATGGPSTAVVNRAYVDRFIPDQELVGRRILLGNAVLMVVGVVENVRLLGPDRDPQPEVYTSYREVEKVQGAAPGRISLMIRVRSDDASLVPFLHRVLAESDPELPLRNVETLGERLASSVAQPRLLAGLVSLFAVMAVLLAVSGIYGVMAQQVAAQTRSIGIRRALGADRLRIVILVLRRSMAWALLGLAVGLVAAWSLAGLLEQVLFGISSRELTAYLLTAGLLLAAAVAACLLPSRRALRVDPAEVLRQG